MELKELVKAELRKKTRDKGTLSTCDKIFRWYEEGGWPQIEENIKRQVKQIVLSAEREIRKIKKITPSR